MIQIKNAKELDGMRRANALSAAALKYGGEHIEAGMTTWELDKLIYEFIIKHGGTPNFKGLYGFPGSACISLNDTVIHGIPSHDIVIRPGDIVSIDTGAKVGAAPGHRAGQGGQPDRRHQPGCPDLLRGGGLLGGAGICGPRHRP